MCCSPCTEDHWIQVWGSDDARSSLAGAEKNKQLPCNDASDQKAVRSSSWDYAGRFSPDIVIVCAKTCKSPWRLSIWIHTTLFLLETGCNFDIRSILYLSNQCNTFFPFTRRSNFLGTLRQIFFQLIVVFVASVYSRLTVTASFQNAHVVCILFPAETGIRYAAVVSLISWRTKRNAGVLDENGKLSGRKEFGTWLLELWNDRQKEREGVQSSRAKCTRFYTFLQNHQRSFAGVAASGFTGKRRHWKNLVFIILIESRSIS